MKHINGMMMAALVFTITAQAAEQGKHLFILSGQSNMARLEPNVSFKPTVARAFGKENVIVVKDAMVGQPIRRWYKDWKPLVGEVPPNNGDLYDQLMGKVNSAISNQAIQTVTFLWMQGEYDARISQGEVYAASLKGLYDQLCRDLGRQDINFVIGRLSDFGVTNPVYPHWAMVREIQMATAESNPRFAWVDTDDVNDVTDQKSGEVRNDLHYSREGYRVFGSRLAEKAIELIRQHE